MDIESLNRQKEQIHPVNHTRKKKQVSLRSKGFADVHVLCKWDMKTPELSVEFYASRCKSQGKVNIMQNYLDEALHQIGYSR